MLVANREQVLVIRLSNGLMMMRLFPSSSIAWAIETRLHSNQLGRLLTTTCRLVGAIASCRLQEGVICSWHWVHDGTLFVTFCCLVVRLFAKQVAQIALMVLRLVSCIGGLLLLLFLLLLLPLKKSICDLPHRSAQ